MSASLVGSEMCIRDSNNNNKHGADNDNDDSISSNIRNGKHNNSNDENHGCLLYTSDAADDM
eukprot:690773-Alexandrium_andersonii.AAC.1